MFNNQIIAGAAGQGGGSFYPYSIDQSLRFNDNDSAKLSRTPSSDGNRQTFTISFWMKRANIGIDQMRILNSNFGGDAIFDLYFEDTDEIVFRSRSRNTNGATFDWSRKSVRKFRDVGSWYHIVIAVDVTVSSPSSQLDLFNFYINGENITSNFTNVVNSERAATSSQVDQRWNSTTTHDIGYNGSSQYFDGYLAEFHNVDGTALSPTSFGETINGVWVSKAYSGSYGTNGFYLPFDDSSAIGDDESGNTNDFTATNLAASDVVPDSPTNNFATINAVHQHFNMTFKEGNLRHETATNNRGVVGNFLLPKSGKWYWEHWSRAFHNPSGNELHNVGINIPEVDLDASRGGRSTGVSIASNTGNVFNESATGTSYGSGWSENQGVAVLFDADAATISFSENGGAFGSAVSIASGTTNQDWIPFVGMGGGSSTEIGFFNFGQDGTFAGETTSGNYTDANGIGNFKWQPPADALALCSANLPEPTLGPNSAEQADDYFNTVLYTGNSGTLEVNGLNFKPDFLWIKRRDSAQNFSNGLLNSVTGIRKGLISNRADAEFTSSGTNDLQSFDNDGFTIGQSNQFSGNDNGGTFVAWSWKAGGTAVSNTDGSITSSVSAAPDAGFSVGTVTSRSQADTIGHGLSQAPEMVIYKPRTGSLSWGVLHTSLSSAGAYLFLESTGTGGSASAYFNSTAPTSSVFSIGSTWGSRDAVFYAFHSVDGYSAVGSYVGNGNADGTFVYTGFRPAFVLIKNTNDVTHWALWDSKRVAYNVITTALYPSSSDADQTGTSLYVDFVSNGFKWRASHNSVNGSSDTFIYLAFAEAPFKYANAR